jgi:hypothetical protein
MKELVDKFLNASPQEFIVGLNNLSMVTDEVLDDLMLEIVSNRYDTEIERFKVGLIGTVLTMSGIKCQCSKCISSQ